MSYESDRWCPTNVSTDVLACVPVTLYLSASVASVHLHGCRSWDRLASANESDSHPTSAPRRANIPGSLPTSNERQSGAERGGGVVVGGGG